MKRSVLSLLVLLMCATLDAQVSLLPRPKKVVEGKGSFSLAVPYVLHGAEGIAVPDWLAAGASEAAARVVEYRLTPMRLVNPADADAVVASQLEAEAYALHIAKDTVVVSAHGPMGFLRAHQTLAQLHDATRRSLPCVDVEDAPAYRWRGVMLDLSRHFFPLDHLYRQVDALARYKINRLHLHLTDAAGWRMEIKRYPRLTSLAAFRTSDDWKTWWNSGREYVPEGSPEAHGGYYTQAELRQLVAYAAERGVEIVPEIEMPAHSEEVLTAYPELSCTHEPLKQADFCPGSVATYDFLEHVLEEVMDVFPSRYIHVGGDEAGKASWPTCPLCQQKMKEEGMTQVAELQAYLIAHMHRFLQKHGRTLIGWDEVLEGEKQTADPSTIMVWRGQEKAAEAIQAGHDVILSPGSHCYLDNVQDAPATQPEGNGGYLPLERVYSYCPQAQIPAEARCHVLGVQGNLWAEYVPTPAHAEMMLYPRALALAEIGWSGEGARPYADFRKAALAEVKTLQADGYAPFDLSREVGQRKESLSPVQHLARGCRVTYNAPFSPQYAAAGEAALTDGVRGGWANNDGAWQGFIGRRGLDVTIDLGAPRKVRSVEADFQQVCNPWIFYPSRFTVSLSADGENFTEVYTRETELEQSGIPTIERYAWSGKAQTARYVRVQALPQSIGGWVFSDEIVVK